MEHTHNQKKLEAPAMFLSNADCDADITFHAAEATIFVLIFYVKIAANNLRSPTRVLFRRIQP